MINKHCVSIFIEKIKDDSKKALLLKSEMVILGHPVQHFLACQGEGIVYRGIAREKAGWKN